MRKLTAVLVGNPNCGKTTLFNALTGSEQYVGNWPGVTVEKKTGQVKGRAVPWELVDLPGLYSLSPYTLEEAVSRDYLLRERPDVILNVLDGTQLMRSLYLSLQLLELELPVVVAVNMMDEAAARGERIDCEELGLRLGVPVLPVTARKGIGLDKLFSAAERSAGKSCLYRPRIPYDAATEKARRRLRELLRERALPPGYPPEYCVSRLLEGDGELLEFLELDTACGRRVARILEDYAAESRCPDRDALLADARYGAIGRLVGQAVEYSRVARAPTPSDRLDKLLLHRVWALPIFAMVMFLVFAGTFSGPGRWLMEGTETLLESVSQALRLWLGRTRTPPWLVSLTTEAILGGVGSVLSFLPPVALLFAFLSFLEDSGYMARAAFLMDRLLRALGLTGRSFIPMLMGFGCTTPAILACRSLENERERQLTVLLMPFMSCSAKLPLYGLLAALFFPARQAWVVFSLYAAGLLTAMLCGLFLSRGSARREGSAFLMELPPYRLPSVGNLLRHVWQKCRGFLQKAGSVIVLMSVLVWFLQSLTPGGELASDAGESLFACLGRWAAPLFAPLGFGDWRAAAALFTGLAAKEMVVSTLHILCGGREELRALFTPLSAYSFLLFALLYMPCMAAFSAACREVGFRRALGNAAFQTGVAYFAAFCVYQFGRLAQYLL